MPRNRVISQSQAIYVGQNGPSGAHSGAGTLQEMIRVQSANYSFSTNTTDINTYGKLGRIGRIHSDTPTVSFDMTYLIAGMRNESGLGFKVDGTTTAIEFLLDKTKDVKNIFELTVPEGEDAQGYDIVTTPDNGKVMGIGNASISSYTAEGAVGGLATASVSFEALNMKGMTSATGIVPAVNPTNGLEISNVVYQIPNAAGNTTLPDAIQPGDITVTIGGDAALFQDMSSVPIQSFNLSVDMARESTKKLGLRFDFSKDLSFPISATLSVDALVSDVGTGNLATLLCNDNQYDLQVDLREPDCNNTGDIVARYELKNANLDSQNFAGSIGPNQTISVTWSAQVGGPQDTTNGLFMSGHIT